MMEAVGGGNSIFYRGNTSPGGVDIRGLDRSVDAWLIEDSRLTSGDAERAATKLDWLGKVEGALSDETNGIKRSEEHTSELQSLMRISYAVFCLKPKNYIQNTCTTLR